VRRQTEPLVLWGMKRVCVALLFVAVACDSGSSAPEKDAEGFVAVPNAQGLKAKVPDSAKPNGVGGAAGFHSEDGKFAFVLEKVEGDEAGKTMDQVKEETELMFFKKWIDSKPTDDGFVLKYESVSIDVFAEEGKEESPQWSFEVRRKIGDQLYKCWGGLKAPDGLDASIEACNSVKTG
jgi:hypothetical protein